MVSPVRRSRPATPARRRRSRRAAPRRRTRRRSGQLPASSDSESTRPGALPARPMPRPPPSRIVPRATRSRTAAVRLGRRGPRERAPAKDAQGRCGHRPDLPAERVVPPDTPRALNGRAAHHGPGCGVPVGRRTTCVTPKRRATSHQSSRSVIWRFPSLRGPKALYSSTVSTRAADVHATGWSRVEPQRTALSRTSSWPTRGKSKSCASGWAIRGPGGAASSGSGDAPAGPPGRRGARRTGARPPPRPRRWPRGAAASPDRGPREGDPPTRGRRARARGGAVRGGGSRGRTVPALRSRRSPRPRGRVSRWRGTPIQARRGCAGRQSSGAPGREPRPGERVDPWPAAAQRQRERGAMSFSG